MGWGAGCRVQGAGRRVQGAGCRVQGAGCGVQGAGRRVQGATFAGAVGLPLLAGFGLLSSDGARAGASPPKDSGFRVQG